MTNDWPTGGEARVSPIAFSGCVVSYPFLIYISHCQYTLKSFLQYVNERGTEKLFCGFTLATTVASHLPTGEKPCRPRPE